MSVTRALALLCLLAVQPVAVAEAAQCRLCAAPTAARQGSDAAGAIRLEIETSLDFDRLVLLAPGEGSATLLPDGSRRVSGTIGAISGKAMVGRGVVRGEPGRAVRIALPRRIELHSVAGAKIAIDDVASDLPGMPRLDSAGLLVFRFGGRLKVSGDAEGDYRGDIPITVEYL